MALAALTGQAITIEKIRAGRAKPGLMRQHLTAVRAVAEVCGGELRGAELSAGRLDFYPGAPQAGDYHFRIGSAGSATLVLQAVLPPLLMAEGESTVVVEGGTHNSMAPPFEFLEHTYGAVLRSMGAAVSFELQAYGFYPAGGGRILARVQGGRPLSPLDLLDTGALLGCESTAVLCSVPDQVGERENRALGGALAVSRQSYQRVASAGPGNVLLVSAHHQELTTVFCGHGRRGVRAERVAAEVAAEVRRFLRAEVPVGEYLADQLLLPMALAGGGRFRTLTPSSHTRTNADVLSLLTGASVRFDERPDGVLVSVSPSGDPTCLGELSGPLLRL